MKTMNAPKLSAALILLLAAGLLALSLNASPAHVQSPDQEVAADSVQVVEITVGPEGFQPERVELEAGIPARLIFTRTTDATCAKQVQIPAFDVEKTDLPLNEPVTIEIMPPEAGTFTFACGMDMLAGAIVVKAD